MVLAAALLAVAAPPARAILPIQQWQTSSGAQVYFVENHELPMLDISVEFPAGSAYDAKGKSGVASMTNRLMRTSTGDMNESDIARRLADVGAVLSGRFDTDRAGLALRTLSSDRERREALGIFARILQQPAFPRDVLEREKGRLIGTLRENDTRPGTIVSLEFYRLVYGSHPYGMRASGDVESVSNIARDDVTEFHRRHYVAQRAVLALMGDVTRAEAEAIAEQVTRGLPEPQGAQPSLQPVAELATGVVRTIAHPALQAHIMIGAPGISRDDRDYIPLYVGNFILGGGGFVSRITDEIRQKRGLAYSVTSYFYPLQRQGPFVVSLQTQRDQAGEAVGVVHRMLREFVKSGPTEQELRAAKQNIIGGFPLRIDSNRKIHEYLSVIGFYRLPLSYLEDFVQNVERVTVSEIRDAFRRRIDPERMVTVVVGPESSKSASAGGN
jgi:zinc protease